MYDVRSVRPVVSRPCTNSRLKPENKLSQVWKSIKSRELKEGTFFTRTFSRRQAKAKAPASAHSLLIRRNSPSFLLIKTVVMFE